MLLEANRWTGLSTPHSCLIDAGLSVEDMSSLVEFIEFDIVNRLKVGISIIAGTVVWNDDPA